MSTVFPIRSMLLVALAIVATGVDAGPVNINTADAATLSRELKGIGMKRAEAIVEYRRKFGPFKSAEELALVKGIGPSAIQKNRDMVRISDVKQTPVTSSRPALATPSKR